MLPNPTGPFRRRAFALALAIGAAASLAACTNDDDRVTAAKGTPAAFTPAPAATTTVGATQPSSPSAPDPMVGVSTAPVSRAATNAEPALLTAVRAAAQDGYDRVVFEFRNAVPGYSVKYVDRPITADGSGDEVGVQGNEVAEIRMENASGSDLSQPSAPATYTGLPRFTPGTSEVVEVVRTGDFEGTLTWVVGTESRAPFRVTTLTGPSRLVVDFASR